LKFSYNWLCELVDGLKDAAGPRELMRQITLKTAECEGVEPFAPWLDRVVAARVDSIEPLPGSHNVKAIVDAGPQLGLKTVVCGAPNCLPGKYTAYVPAGVPLNGREIGKVVIEGVESDGMLASGMELGINRDHSGIVELGAAKPGSGLERIVPDFEIEVDNKSLTHRPDLWGHHGMAREVAAFTGLRLNEPVDLGLLPDGAPEWNVEIRDFDLCPRYSALVFDNVKVGPSPLWLQARLEAIGLNPISNIVDVTNFVMAEIAQPMHAFDADKLRGATIIVRRAEDGETIHALNGENYTLSRSNLVIADKDGAVALAGVIGGMESAISEATTRIVLESANFNAASVRKTSAALKLRTDASMRFEKAQDARNTLRGLARAVALLNEICPGIRLVGGLVDSWNEPAAVDPIELPMDWLQRKLGRSIEAAEVRSILDALCFRVEDAAPGVFHVHVPSWRATRDVTIKDDLVEEVGRMIGYDSIPPQAPLQPVKQPWINQERNFHHAVRELAAAQGYTETYNYSFLSDEMVVRFGMDPAAHLRVANPISSENNLMRRSLLPGLHRNLLENAKRFSEFRLFEIGNEIHPRGAGELPDEVPHLMAAIYSQGSGEAGLFELKRLAECLMPGCEATQTESRQYEHPARSATILWRNHALGRLFELHPTLVESGRGAILDIDLRKMQQLAPREVKYRPLNRFPSSGFDLSIVTPLREPAGVTRARLAEAAGEVDSIEYLRQYTGSPLPEDRKSVSYRITVSAPDHTLTNEEVNAVRDRIISKLKSLGYELRV